MSTKPQIIVVVGPTASGKSELGVYIAKKINGEIVSADSRQVYRGLDMGSGKVPGKWVFRKEDNNLPLSSTSLRRRGKEKREYLSFLGGGYNCSLSREYDYQGVRHHCLDVANPKKTFTAADFVACGRRAITDILLRGKTPIIVGGTGFYIDALLGKMSLAPVPPNPMLRKKLVSYSTTRLFNYLTKLDPARANTIDKNNPRRLIRAIEIVSSSKCPPHASIKSDSLGWQKQKSKTKINNKGGYIPPPSPSLKKGGGKGVGYLPTPHFKLPTIIWLGIKRSPEDIKKRIHQRLITRLPGIIREVKKLHRRGVSWKRMNELGLEYRYVSRYIRAISEVRPPKTKNVKHWKFDMYTTMVAKLQMAIWHYAKRQMTWWRKNKEIRWFNSLEETLKYVREHIGRK